MPTMNTIEQCDARLQELEQLNNGYYSSMSPIWNEQREIETMKKDTRRRSFVSVVNSKQKFKQRCLEIMKMSEADCPQCLCSHQENAKDVLERLQKLCGKQLGIGQENLLFAPHPRHPKEPISSLIKEQRGCYTIDNFLEALREHMMLLLMSESELQAARENEKRIRNATNERIMAMTETEFVDFYALLGKEKEYSGEHLRGKKIREVYVYDKPTDLIVYMNVIRMPDSSLLGWEHAHRPCPF